MARCSADFHIPYEPHTDLDCFSAISPLQSKVQHADGIIYIQQARKISRSGKQPPPRFVPSETPRGKTPWEKSWAGVVRGSPQADTRPAPASACSPPAAASASSPTAPASSPAQTISKPSTACPPATATMVPEMASMIRDIVMAAVAPLDQRITSLAAQFATAKEGCSSASHSSGERRDSRTESRQRRRLPIGKKLYQP